MPENDCGVRGAGEVEEKKLIMEKTEEVSSLICRLYKIVHELESLFPSRPFTPDGHLVGSIGEVLAAYHYGLKLLPASQKTHDAISNDGRKVQIKTTQRKMIGLRSKPEHLLVLRILSNGSIEEVYNGPGKLAWENAGKVQNNGQRPIYLSKLSKLVKDIPNKERLPKVDVVGK